MNRKSLRYRGRGFVPLEMLAVVCVIAILLGLGVVVISNAKEQAHLAQAEGRLRQVGTALDLYFKQNGAYPAAGDELEKVLEPFLQDMTVCENCIGDIDISDLYEELSLAEIDLPEQYIAAFASRDGKTMIMLKTMGKIVRKTDLNFDPKDYRSAKYAALSAILAEVGEELDTFEDVDKQEGRVVKYKLRMSDISEGKGQNLETVGVSIKFEAVGDQLGQEDVTEYDRFSLKVQIANNADLDVQPVAVSIKAGTQTLVPDIGDANGTGVTFGDLMKGAGEDPVPLVVPGTHADEPNGHTGWEICISKVVNDDGTTDTTVELILNIDIGADGTQEHELSNVQIDLEGGVDVLEVLPTERFEGELTPQ